MPGDPDTAALAAAGDALRYRAIFDGAIDFAIIATDREGRITDWNRGAERIFGWPEAEVRGTSILRIFTAEDLVAGIPARKIAEALAHGRATAECWHSRAGGGRFWGSGELRPLRGPDGAQLGFVKVLRDRTDRRRDEEALRRSEALLRTAILSAPLPTMLHAEDGEVLEVSRKWLDLTGYAREEVATRAVWERRAFPGREQETVEAVETLFAGDGDRSLGEWQVRTRDGGTRIWDFHSAALGRLPDGRRMRITSAVDVTERRAAEARLHDNERRLATLIEHLPVGIAFVDRNGRTLISNPAMRRFLPDSVLPSFKPAAEAIYVAHDTQGRPLAREDFPAARALRGETEPGVEFLHRMADGSTMWGRVGAVPLRDSDATVIGAVIYVIDIDGEKRALARLERLAATLEQQVEERTADLLGAEAALRQSQKMEAVGQLTGGIAHDFNNILTALSGNLELAQGRLAAGRTDGIERFVAAAQNAADRAAGITQRLLAFARRQALAPVAIDLDGLVSDMTELIARAVGPRITVTTAPGTGGWQCRVDRNQIESALLNLCINARDAMAQDGALTIATGICRLDAAAARALELPAGDYVTLAVRDGGTGMPPDVAARAFDPFFTTKPAGAGTGLGLSMVYGFVRQSGGQIRLDTAPGAGTTVTLWLPRDIHADTAS
jgi:PAS domain S-box-containing protein